MNYLQAIKLLSAYHVAQLVAAYKTESGITGQLSTGLVDLPFIPVNDSQVSAADLFEVLEAYEDSGIHADEYFTDTDTNPDTDNNLLSLFGYETGMLGGLLGV